MKPKQPSQNHDGKAQPLSKEEEARQKYRRKRRFRRAGQALMLAAVVIGVQHWLWHLGMFGGDAPLWSDFYIGYPTAALLLIAGAMTVGPKR